MTFLHVVFAAGYALAAGVGYLLGLWKTKSEIDKVKWDLAQGKLAVETQSLAQLLLRITEAWKKRMKTRDLQFSEEELRESLHEEDSLRLSAALDLLLAQGRAKQVGLPGYWQFD